MNQVISLFTILMLLIVTFSASAIINGVVSPFKTAFDIVMLSMIGFNFFNKGFVTLIIPGHLRQTFSKCIFLILISDLPNSLREKVIYTQDSPLAPVFKIVLFSTIIFVQISKGQSMAKCSTKNENGRFQVQSINLLFEIVRFMKFYQCMNQYQACHG
ncbi:hypothetical protein FGO68_gene395 [Halteria grandinella]|uniref:Uncharacterized protein n=1 Tax=Halteria grandinella TaxID=5974 RepID=A0A8J8P6M7_HALGN|nr:hypothetical protein FGO68_gene395 [Halteria grandinella]